MPQTAGRRAQPIRRVLRGETRRARSRGEPGTTRTLMQRRHLRFPTPQVPGTPHRRGSERAGRFLVASDAHSTRAPYREATSRAARARDTSDRTRRLPQTITPDEARGHNPGKRTVTGASPGSSTSGFPGPGSRSRTGGPSSRLCDPDRAYDTARMRRLQLGRDPTWPHVRSPPIGSTISEHRMLRPAKTRAMISRPYVGRVQPWTTGPGREHDHDEEGRTPRARGRAGLRRDPPRRTVVIASTGSTPAKAAATLASAARPRRRGRRNRCGRSPPSTRAIDEVDLDNAQQLGGDHEQSRARQASVRFHITLATQLVALGAFSSGQHLRTESREIAVIRPAGRIRHSLHQP